MYNDLLFRTMQTPAESQFEHKCCELLKYFSKDILCDEIAQPFSSNTLFSHSTLSVDEINHVLLRKYYLSNHHITNSTILLDSSIEIGDFETVNNLLTRNSIIRKTVFSIYVDNINSSNTELAKEKNLKKSYDEINQTLTAIDTYYSKKKNETANFVLKKHLS